MLISPSSKSQTAARWMNWLASAASSIWPPMPTRLVKSSTIPAASPVHWPPGHVQDVILYNWDIATSDESPNPYLGTGKLDGNGIPADFFADVHIRKAFTYCFDWDTLINDVYNGEAVQPVGLPLPGMPGYDLGYRRTTPSTWTSALKNSNWPMWTRMAFLPVTIPKAMFGRPVSASRWHTTRATPPARP